MIVLSVYYMTSPENDDLAYINNGQDEMGEVVNTNADPTEVEGEAQEEAEGEAEVDSITNLGEDELFTMLDWSCRMNAA